MGNGELLGLRSTFPPWSEGTFDNLPPQCPEFGSLSSAMLRDLCFKTPRIMEDTLHQPIPMHGGFQVHEYAEALGFVIKIFLLDSFLL